MSRSTKLIKLSNFIIFSFTLLILLLSGSYKNISNSILAIVPESENKKILKAYETNSDSKTIFIAIKGKEKETLKKMDLIKKEFLKIDGLSSNKKNFNKELLNYQNSYQLYLNKIDKKALENLDIKNELEKIKEKLLNSFFPTLLNKQDPLGLFKEKKHVENFKLKNGYLVLKDYGLLASFKLNKNINSLKQYQKIYKEIENIKSVYPEIKAFSTIFYFVENSNAIKNDVEKIAILAISLLLLLYLVLLRNIKLLTNVLTTLATSAAIATFIVTSAFQEVSIFVLVFGISISTVAIDYMFHHYMHGYYQKKKPFNKEVFFGLLTTLIAFESVSYISFALIQQISLFTMISLLVSYLHFAFLYPKIKFKRKVSRKTKKFKYKIKTSYILLFSTILIIISIITINFDTNLRNLDYKNEKLNNLDTFFKNALNQKENIPLLIKTDSIEDLISKYEKIKTIGINSSLDLLISNKEFETINTLLKNKEFLDIKKSLEKEAQLLGFKEDYFKDAYKIKELPNYNFQTLKNLGINYFEYDNKKYVILNIKEKKYLEIKNLEFIKPLSLKYLFSDALNSVKNQIFTFGLIALCFIILMLLIITRQNFLFALSFLLFPLALILCASFFISFNILHIFMMFIILAISIDYAIYSSKSLDLNTKKAILFSLLSTFAGFGVLIFSSINSLYSIGIVATIGILAISFLLIFTKRSNKNDY